jgi:predicted DNA-binding transcriptional regulator AlpA
MNEYPADVLLTEKEAAALLGLRPNTLNAWRNRATGPKYLRIGRKAIRYRLLDVLAFRDCGVTENEGTR